MSESPDRKVVVYTAIFDFVDSLKEPDYLPDNCKFVCFTNLPFKSDIYEIRYVDEELTEDRVRNAKIYKILSHRYFPEYEYTVWIDGTRFLTCNIHDLIGKYLADADMALFSHRWRNCLYAEAKECIAKGRDHPGTIRTQMKKYRNEGYPENNGLITGGIILRRNSRSVQNLNELWWNEIKRHSRRDQLSFNYIAHRNNFKFSIIDGDYYHNPYFGYIPHLSQLKKLYSDYLTIRDKKTRLAKEVNRFRATPEYKFHKIRKKLKRALG